MENENLPKCCRHKNKEGKGLKQGIIYGLVPHIGCIAFIIFSVLGVTVAASVFKPLLSSKYLFYGLMALSLLFATVSALFYLKKQGLLSFKGIRIRKNYLLTLYGATLLVNLLFFFVIFPAVANIQGISGEAVSNEVSLTLEVNIPCPGHASLITEELKSLDGVDKVEYAPLKTFKVYYNPEKLAKEDILNLKIFKEYTAKEA